MSLCQPIIWSMAAILRDSTVPVANFRIVNGRCHFLRSMPFQLTVDAFSNGRCQCCSRGTMGENAKTGYFAQFAFWVISLHPVQNGGRSTRGGGEDRWRSGH